MGSLIFGFVYSKFGPKMSLHSIAALQITSFMLVAYSETKYFILMSRLFAGISGGGIYIAVPLFVSEIADDM